MSLGLRKWLIHRSYSLLARRDVSIISDDCWGGEFYRLLHIPYTTPTVGLYVEPSQYLDFVENLRRPDAFDLQWVATEHGFPVARTPYATLYCLHYSSGEEALETVSRRAKRINWDRLRVKIDFGKGYSEKDVARWNRMKLPNSLAIVPASLHPGIGPVWHSVVTPEWQEHGLKMCAISANFFDFPRWTRTGEVRFSFWNRWVSKMVSNDRVSRRVKSRLMGCDLQTS